MIKPFDLLKAIQLRPRFLFAFWLFGVLVLALPDGMAKSFGIFDFRDLYRGWVGVLTLGAFVFWCVQLLPLWMTSRNRRKYQEEILRGIETLSSEERFLLAYCIDRQRRSVHLEIDNAAAASLCQKGLFQRAEGVASILSWPHTIPLFVWEHLQIHREAIFPASELADPRAQEAFTRFEKKMRFNAS